MMKQHNMLSWLLAFCLCFMVAMPAWAADYDAQNEQVISFEEFYETLKEAYANEDMEYRIIDFDCNLVFTKEMLQEKLAELQKFVNIRETFSSNDIVELDIKDSKSDVTRGGYMPVQETYYAYKQINGGLGYAQMRIKLVATVNSQNQDLMSVDDYDCRQIGVHSMFNSWELLDIFATPNYNNDTVYVEATGIGDFTYFDQYGINQGISAEYTLSHTFSTR